MRLIQVEQSDEFQISYRLIAGAVCANRMQAAKNEWFRSANLSKIRENRTCSLPIRFKGRTRLTWAALNVASALRESGFTAKQKPRGQPAAPGPLEQKI
jgi:hypothetical protein